LKHHGVVTKKIQWLVRRAAGAAGAVSGGGVDQAYDGWRVLSQFEFQQWWKAVIPAPFDYRKRPIAEVIERIAQLETLGVNWTSGTIFTSWRCELGSGLPAK
jgi:hypothetical protein